MLGRTRVGKKLDVQRLASAVKRPGIDTRCWVSLAVAIGETKVDLEDGKEGVFVDVKLMPSEEEVTARLGPAYAGDGFGLYTRVREDDEVIVVIPSGINAEGPVVISRLWSAADKPPSLAGANDDDVILVVENDKDLRITLGGTGTLRINVDDANGSPQNQLVLNQNLFEIGRENATDKLVVNSKMVSEVADIRSRMSALASQIEKMQAAVNMYLTPLMPNPGKPVDQLIPAQITANIGGSAQNIILGEEAKLGAPPVGVSSPPGTFNPLLLQKGGAPQDLASTRATIDR